ncbi:MAG: DNA primase [Actinobacteria bacterium]|nr:DNA primase [Actinomycetota bacterium]
MNKSLKEGEINELKSRADIQNIISGYVNLKKAGKNYLGLCPFHKEKTPSFTVDARRQLYHCFGCSEGGDVISFIMKIENLDFIEAAEFLAKKVNYNLNYVYSGSPEISEKKSKLVELNELAKKYYNFVLFSSKAAQAAKNYLIKRGFTVKTLEKFEIGYSIDSWNNFCLFAEKRGFKKKEIIDCGLAIPSTKNSNEIYDRFRGRIMFPIKDLIGKTIGFGGRIVPLLQQDGPAVSTLSGPKNGISSKQAINSKQQKPQSSRQTAKYVNSPETKLYSKSHNIYGLFEAKNSIVEKDEVFIVEGYTDVMALHQADISNTVASLGTALTGEQIELLSRFTKNVTLVFDSDTAGVNASLKGIERLREYNEKLDLYNENNINIKVAVLEEGYDPADYVIKKGKGSFLEKSGVAAGIIDFTIGMIIKKYNLSNLNEKLNAADELLKLISTLSSKIVQEECVKKIAQRLNLREDLLIEQMQKRSYLASSKSRILSEERNEDNIVSPLKNIEIEALKILINGSGCKFNELLEIGPDYFKFNDIICRIKLIYEEIEGKKKSGIKINFPLEISSDKLEIEDTRKLYNFLIFSPQNVYTSNDLASIEIYNNLKKIFISDQIEVIKKQMIKIENYQKEIKRLKADLKENEITRLENARIKEEKIEAKIKELGIKLNDLEAEKRKYILQN